MHAVTRRRDPGPAPLAWRLTRLWRRRWLRRLLTLQLPLLALAAAGAHVAANPALHAAVASQVAGAQALLAETGRFTIERIEIEGASDKLAGQIRATLADVQGASSLGIDAAALRRRIEELGRVAEARVALEAPDGLEVRVIERTPAAIWRHAGSIAAPSASISQASPACRQIAAGDRLAHRDLPVLSGLGADAAAREALAILAAARPLADRVRGLIRVGERRWDLALDRDTVVMLPMTDPVDALTAALALHASDGLFDRDLIAVDLRLPERPTFRLPPRAVERLNALRAGDLPGEDA